MSVPRTENAEATVSFHVYAHESVSGRLSSYLGRAEHCPSTVLWRRLRSRTTRFTPSGHSPQMQLRSQCKNPLKDTIESVQTIIRNVRRTIVKHRGKRRQENQNSRLAGKSILSSRRGVSDRRNILYRTVPRSYNGARGFRRASRTDDAAESRTARRIKRADPTGPPACCRSKY